MLRANVIKCDEARGCGGLGCGPAAWRQALAAAAGIPAPGGSAGLQHTPGRSGGHAITTPPRLLQLLVRPAFKLWAAVMRSWCRKEARPTRRKGKEASPVRSLGASWKPLFGSGPRIDLLLYLLPSL